MKTVQQAAYSVNMPGMGQRKKRKNRCEKPDPGRFEGVLSEARPVRPETKVLTFTIPPPAGLPRPGQFFMIKLYSEGFPLFGRAFSLLDCRLSAGEAEVDFLVQTVGRGTGIMNSAAPGSKALLVGPAGNGFPESPPGGRLILVGGGTGIAPFHMLMKSLSHEEKGSRDLVLLHGARDRASLYLADRLESFSFPVEFSTEDGSRGTRGMVDLLLKKRLSPISKDGTERRRTWIFACGPNPMMDAVALLGRESEIPTYLSLETRMACGIGICNGCVVPAEGDTEYLRVCHEGPVFLSRGTQYAITGS